MVNATYVNWLVTWIKSGTTNIKTGKAFVIGDIINDDYKTAVQTILNTN